MNWTATRIPSMVLKTDLVVWLSYTLKISRSLAMLIQAMHLAVLCFFWICIFRNCRLMLLRKTFFIFDLKDDLLRLLPMIVGTTVFL